MRPTWPWRRSWWVAFAMFAGVGALWAFSTPLMAAPDEPSHVINAAAVVRGEFLERRATVVGPHLILTNFFVRVPASLAATRQIAVCFAFRPSVSAGCAPRIGDRTTVVTGSTRAGAYPPLYYLLVGWPSLILHPRAAVYAMRLCSVLVAAAFLATAWTSARSLTRSSILVVAVALALTPMTFFLVGSVNPSGMEIAAGLATWLTVLDLLSRSGPAPSRLIVWAALSAGTFAAARPLGPLLCVVTVMTVAAAAGSRHRLAEVASDRRVRWATAAVGTALIGSVIWIVESRVSSTVVGLPIPGLTRRTALAHSVGVLPEQARQMVGVFGWLDTYPPHWLWWAWGAAAVLLVAAALIVGTWRHRLILLGAVAATLTLTAMGNALNAPKYGYGWQGRYTLPLAVGILILAGWVLSKRGPSSLWLERSATVGTVAGVTVGQFVAHSIAMDRNVVGLPSSFLGYVGGHGWSPPLRPATMLILAIAVFAGYGAWLLASAMTVAEDSTAAP